MILWVATIIALNGRIIWNKKVGKIKKEEFVAYFEVIMWHMPNESEEKSVLQLKFEPIPTWVQAYSVTAWATLPRCILLWI